MRPGAEARRRADLALRVRRRDDGARAGDVAREEQRENARLYSDLEDDCGEAHNVVGQHLPKDHEPDDEPDAHCDQRSSSEVELVVPRRPQLVVAGGLLFARCRGSAHPSRDLFVVLARGLSGVLARDRVRLQDDEIAARPWPWHQADVGR